jgi:hypothetical protein
MGYWKNPGQTIIKAQASTGICPLGTWLRQLNPFQDLSSTATCDQVASYVSSVIGAANCGGATCNLMLKSQMLATALDVYFSDVTLGGNKIGAPAPVGAVAVDLSKSCSNVSNCSGSKEEARPEFGICTGTGSGAPSCTPAKTGSTILNLLAYSDFCSAYNGSGANGTNQLPAACGAGKTTVSNNGGTAWYQQNKTMQTIAKDVFDAINNEVVNVAPSSATPSY